MNSDINIIALVKGEERYTFLFTGDRVAEVLRVMGRFASNPELNFSWYDAAVLSQRVKQEQTVKSKQSGTHRFKDSPIVTDAEDQL